eukprot:TRINITY_DN7308_c0_g1_i1.p1 TRINITY_DN7308_c0_g1~~TRINITY_DN7308_c0_g1_i1.p1  ORF type:complete len:811 (+),score=331.14 TRINITY_DN7308_c0_g1_i1:204-2636(+)
MSDRRDRGHSSSSSSSRHKDRSKDKDRKRDDSRHEEKRNNGDGGEDAGEDVAQGMEFAVNNAGEISATIEQTNRIRAKLGLKPLKVEDKEETERKQREEGERARSEQEKMEREEKVLERIEAMKEKRLATSIIASKSIADEVDDEEEDAMNWVERSRLLQKEREKQLAAKRAKMLDEFDEEVEQTVSAGKNKNTRTKGKATNYSENDLSGLTVAHSLKEIDEGEPIILTLKDARIVEGDDLNDEGDELENIGLMEKEKTDKNNELRKKKKVYDVYAEAASGEKSNILSQYDDEKPKQKFVIGAENKTQSAESALERIRKKLASKKEPIKQEYDLSIPQSHVASEYYTQDEMVQFRNAGDSSKKKKLRKKKKSKEVVEDEEEDVDRADHGSKKLSEILLEEAMDIEDQSKDRGSRKASVKSKRDAERREQQEQNRLRGYSKALEKAEDTARVLRDDEEEGEIKSASIKTEGSAEKSTIDLKKVDIKIPSRKAMKSDARAWLDDDEDDKEYEEDDLDTGLWKSIATSAKTSIKNPASLIASKVKVEKPSSTSSGLVFSSTSEFCRNIQTTTTTTAHHSEAKKEKSQHELPEVKMEDASVKIKKEKMEDDSSEEETEITPVLGEEPLVAGGLAATLAMLKRKGEFDPLATESFAGRKTDKPVEWKLDNQGVKLEYRDNKGRLLTPKEAFRQLSHKFHGKAPSKNTIEKRERQRAEEERKKKMALGDTPLHTVKAMQEQQTKSKLPYVVLSGNVSRSGSLAADGDFENEITEDLLAKKPVSSSSSSSGGEKSKKTHGAGNAGGEERSAKKARGK